jgi:hypothetical protein
MATLSDSRFESLRTQGHTGATSDMILQWLQANGASSGAIPDAWEEMLAANGFVYGQRNDAWFAFLGSLGYEGSLNDRELAFWESGGTISPDGVRITDQPDNWSGLENATATFTVVATSGDASPMTYQWQEYVAGWSNISDGGSVSGATTDTLSIATVQLADNGRRFRCAVTNDYNTIYSQSARIIITGATWFIITEGTGERTITETLLDYIIDEEST